MTRVAVFVDYQNVYSGARQAFGTGTEPSTFGQVSPYRVGLLLAHRGLPVDPTRVLHQVTVYRGEPSPAHSPTAQAACQRQVGHWAAQPTVRVVTRPLRYQKVGLVHQAREKGIDVCIAVDMVIGAMADGYDTGVLFSGDTDLVPALEAVQAVGKRVEVAAWRSRRHRHSRRLAVPGGRVWCHWLDAADHERVADPVDYTRPVPTMAAMPSPDDAIAAAHAAAVAAGEPGYADPETGLFVFTAAYLAARGTCCDSGCRHCPYRP